MKTQTRIISALFFAMLFVFSGLTLAGPAHAAASVVSISDGTLAAKGTAVSGTYTATCQFFDESVSVSVELRQRAGGKKITTATFNDSFRCAGDGTPVTRQYVFANSASAFKNGPATVTGTIFSSTCCVFTSEAVFQEVRLSKK